MIYLTLLFVLKGDVGGTLYLYIRPHTDIVIVKTKTIIEKHIEIFRSI